MSNKFDLHSYPRICWLCETAFRSQRSRWVELGGRKREKGSSSTWLNFIALNSHLRRFLQLQSITNFRRFPRNTPPYTLSSFYSRKHCPSIHLQALRLDPSLSSSLSLPDPSQPYLTSQASQTERWLSATCSLSLGKANTHSRSHQLEQPQADLLPGRSFSCLRESPSR